MLATFVLNNLILLKIFRAKIFDSLPSEYCDEKISKTNFNRMQKTGGFAHKRIQCQFRRHRLTKKVSSNMIDHGQQTE